MVNRTVSTRSYSNNGSNEALLLNHDDGNAVQSGTARKLVTTVAEQSIGLSSNSSNSEKTSLSSRSVSSVSTRSLMLPSPGGQNIPRHSQPHDSTKTGTRQAEKRISGGFGSEGLSISSMQLMKNLQTIVDGEGWGKVINCGLMCYYGFYDNTTDQQWLEYLHERIERVDRLSATDWHNKADGLRVLIQHILFFTFHAVQRFNYTNKYVSHVLVAAVEEDIKTILKQYYCEYGTKEFWKIFDHNTYPFKNSDGNENGNYWLVVYDFDMVRKTLAEHFNQTNDKYLPDIVRRLLNAGSNCSLENILELTEAQCQKRTKNERLSLFTERSLSEQFTRVQCMQGLKNFGSTCFAAASVWPIICSPYCTLLDISSEDATGQPSTTPLPDTNEQYLCLLCNETSKDQQIRLLRMGLAKCLTTLARQYRLGQYLAMQSTYKLLLDFCIQGATQGNFKGFEDFEAVLSQRLSHLKRARQHRSKNSVERPHRTVVVHPKHLPQQDCAEFYGSLLQVVLPREQLHKCAFWVLTERQVVSQGKTVTIIDNPQLGKQTTEAEQSVDLALPDTLIFWLPVAPEQADREDFSLQMLLDQALTFQNVSHRNQRITVRQDSFRHTVQNCPLAPDRDNKEKEWDILSERQVLLVNEAPRVITIQPKIPAEFDQRAAIAQKLASDQARELTLSFRKISADDTLPPETITHSYRVRAKVFYVDSSGSAVRHYRCSIHDEKWGELLIDDGNIYQPDGGQNDCTKRGILCLMVLEHAGANDTSS